jgi:F-type H+-transporting ATPase subunit delta
MARRVGSARRYAEAAFAVATEANAVEAWHDDLRRAAAIVSDEELSRLLQNPAIPYEQRREALERSLGDVADGIRNLTLLLLQRRRLELLPAVAEHVHRLVNARDGVVEGVVTSAAPLHEDEERELRAKLEPIAGGRLELRYEVDPSLLGGVVVRLGDRLLDGSVRGRLERLRDRLVSSAL